MTTTGAGGGQASESSEALDLFEGFLAAHHAGSGGFEELCAAHPEHAGRFRRWWDHLLEAGEVSDTPGSVGGGGEPDEGDRFGPYRVLRELGRGGQGAVFLAEDTRLGRQVALKVLPLARLHGRDPHRRFAREAELASRLHHAGLCTVFERGVHDSTAFLAMRYVEGETLAAYVARARRRAEAGEAGEAGAAVRLPNEGGDDPDGIDEREAVRRVLVLFEKVARALHAAHEAQLVHRDLKPGNLMVDPGGEPVVLDFGLARDVSDESPALTRTGDAVGTPAYMSPEQIAGLAGVDRRADVYGLAAALYECLTLRRPVEAATRAELYRRILDVEPARAWRLNRALPRDLGTVLDTALQKSPAARYRTAEDLAEDLRRVRCRESILARPAGLLVRGWRWAQRNRGVAASLVALFVALAGGLAISLHLQGEMHLAQLEERRMLERLTDEVRLDDARRAAMALWPIGEDSGPELAEWLRTFGEPLAMALGDHSSKRDALRARALPETSASRAAARAAHPDGVELQRLRDDLALCRDRIEILASQRGPRPRLEQFADRLEARIAAGERALEPHRPYRFASRSDQALHDGLSGLVARLEEAVAPGGLIDRVRRHHAWAVSVNSRVDGEHAGRWREAVAYAGATDGPYRGLALAPQPGLVPIGSDPESELLEFGFERSGAIPERDPTTGGLLIDADSAIVFALVPGGTYRLGRGAGAERLEERFEREVDLDAFLVAKHELSRHQWQELSGRGPPGASFLSMMFDSEPDHPVDFVSWVETYRMLLEFGLELPTEAQWEYAATGGRPTAWWWGDGMPPRPGAWDNLRDRSFERAAGRAARRGNDDGYAGLAPVFAPFEQNPFGLVSVHGNVAEWCREPFLPKTPLDVFQVEQGDGRHLVPTLGLYAVRGGRFDTPWAASRATARAGQRGVVGHIGLGVRPVRRVR